ncbi:UrcA family protein [Porphyrobacter sp. MBR-155]|jgi:UrcA family protein|uniref:UrcA family protein n=1 Tax=Porphyrobacter sp. MBR-155 TaxID=3156464 RepID=UPI00339688C3
MTIRFFLPVLAFALAVPAAAETVTVKVPFGDLDLTKETDRAALDRRLARATHKACGSPSARDISVLRSYRACVDEARATYQPQVGLALDNANARRVAVLADKLGMLASF